MKATLIPPLSIIAAAMLAAARAPSARGAEDSLLPPAARDGKEIPPDQHPLAAAMNQFLKSQAALPTFQDSKLTRADYLAVIASELKAMQKYQNDAGRIIDPVQKSEVQYATPCFAHAVAVLATAHHPDAAALLEPGLKAMDAATGDMAKGNNFVPNKHGDFFTWPVMKAFALYKDLAAGPAPLVTPERVEQWRKNLAQITPQKLYQRTVASATEGGNWNLVNTSGEFLRHQAGLTDMDYVEKNLQGQQSSFTDLGMFHENGDPLPYDQFARYFIVGIMDAGYRGASFTFYRDAMWRAAWVSLFIQSPTGQAPTGFRSSHHIWNEAQMAAVCECYAHQYAAAGRTAEAGAFKRAAHLSLACIQQWLRPDGSGYVVKNKYPIEAKHGYEDYSSHTQYNLLACSMLGAAYLYADESVPERPAPADTGGFVVPILTPFHKVFANVAGAYAEYDTSGDHVYNPTGLIRVHLPGANPELGPSDGLSTKFSGRGVNVAVGPAWQDAARNWHSLAEQTAKPSVTVLQANVRQCSFIAQYTLPAGAAPATQVTETVTVLPGSVSLKDEIVGDVPGFHINFPMLVFDGQDQTQITMNEAKLVLKLAGRGVQVTAVEPSNAIWMRTDKQVPHRNGMAEVAYIEVPGKTAEIRIEAAK